MDWAVVAAGYLGYDFQLVVLGNKCHELEYAEIHAVRSFVPICHESEAVTNHSV